MKSLNYFKKYTQVVENSQYDILAQVGYFIKDKYGDKEYNSLQDAGVISLQDGDTTINITTTVKPEDSNADSITKVLRGFLSSYTKYDGLKENVRATTKLVQDFASTLIAKYPIKDIKLFYYPESKTENIIVLNYIEVDKEHKNSGIGSRIMNDLVAFADNENFIITLNTTDKFGSSVKRLKSFYERFGFKVNKDRRFTEQMIRLPKSGIGK